MGFPGEQGFSFQKYKSAIYIFGSALTVVFLVALQLLTPLWACIVVMGFGVLKQLVWDVIWHKQAFDWLDLVFMLMGVAFAFLCTAGYYKLMGIW